MENFRNQFALLGEFPQTFFFYFQENCYIGKFSLKLIFWQIPKTNLVFLEREFRQTFDFLIFFSFNFHKNMLYWKFPPKLICLRSLTKMLCWKNSTKIYCVLKFTQKNCFAENFNTKFDLFESFHNNLFCLKIFPVIYFDCKRRRKSLLYINFR